MQVVAGIKKLSIMMTIGDNEVSVDNLIEDFLTSEPNNEYIQSCDIVAFNKICKCLLVANSSYCCSQTNSVSSLLSFLTAIIT